MARVHFVKAAAKDYPDHGIKKGESYYWWAFRYGGKRYSKTQPKQSQLTQSEFLGQWYSIQESYEQLSIDDYDDPDDLIGDLENLRDEVQQLLDETEEKHSNIEDKFPGGCPVLDTLQERMDACEQTIESFEQTIDGLRDLVTDEEDEIAEKLDQLRDEAEGPVQEPHDLAVDGWRDRASDVLGEIDFG